MVKIVRGYVDFQPKGNASSKRKFLIPETTEEANYFSRALIKGTVITGRMFEFVSGGYKERKPVRIFSYLYYISNKKILEDAQRVMSGDKAGQEIPGLLKMVFEGDFLEDRW